MQQMVGRGADGAPGKPFTGSYGSKISLQINALTKTPVASVCIIRLNLLLQYRCLKQSLLALQLQMGLR
jgi:hypothetical protein